MLRPSRLSAPVAALALIAFAYLALLLILPNQGAWCGDNAYRVLQVQTLVRDKYSAIAIPWPGSAIAASPKFLPVAPPFITVGVERFQRAYSVYFAALASPLYAAMGYAGLKVLPLLGSLLLLWGCACLVSHLGGNLTAQAAAVLLVGLCSPVLFYTGTFWEHTLALAAIIWSLVFLLRTRQSKRLAHTVTAALLLAASIWLREEHYLFAPLLLIAIPEWRLRFRFALLLGGIIGLLWLTNYRLYNDIFGLHVRFNQPLQNGLADYLHDRAIVLYRTFLLSSPHVWLSVLLVSPFLLAVALMTKRSVGALRLVVIIGATLTGIWMLWSGWAAPHRGAWLAHAGSLFPVCPLIVTGLFRLPKDEAEHTLLRRIVIAYAIVAALIMPPEVALAFHWAHRMLLPVYPLLIVLGCVFFARQVATRYWPAFGALILITFMLQLFSLHLLHVRKTGVAEFVQTVQQVPDAAIISESREILDYLFPVFFSRMIFYAESQGDRDELVKQLRAAEVDEFLLISDQPQGVPFAGVQNRRGLMHSYFIYRYRIE